MDSKAVAKCLVKFFLALEDQGRDVEIMDQLIHAVPSRVRISVAWEVAKIIRDEQPDDRVEQALELIVVGG